MHDFMVSSLSIRDESKQIIFLYLLNKNAYFKTVKTSVNMDLLLIDIKKLIMFATQSHALLPCTSGWYLKIGFIINRYYGLDY